MEGLGVPAHLKIVKNGSSIFESELSKKKTQEVSFAETPTHKVKYNWYRCEIFQRKRRGELIAFTNPIYLEAEG